jgi:hypothetical protein
VLLLQLGFVVPNSVRTGKFLIPVRFFRTTAALVPLKNAHFPTNTKQSSNSFHKMKQFLAIVVMSLLLGQAASIKLNALYLDYLYKKYKSDVTVVGQQVLQFQNSPAAKQLHEIIQATKHNKNAGCKTSKHNGEIIYMHMRETCAKISLSVFYEGDVTVQYWMLHALEKNVALCSGQTSTMLALVVQGKIPVANDVISYARQLAKSVKVSIIEVKPDRFPHVPTEQLRTLNSISFDVIYYNMHGSKRFLMNHVLEPLLVTRTDDQAGVLLFVDAPAVTVPVPVSVPAATGNIDSTEDIFRWLHTDKNVSVDVTEFGGVENLRLLDAAATISTLGTPKTVPGAIPDESCSLTLATIVPRPRVTIILPITRPHFLPNLLRSIRFPLIAELIIVYSQNMPRNSSNPFLSPLGKHNNPKIVEVFNKDLPGIYGNPERTIGLAKVPKDRVGWVYFLDDDNFMHENMWMVMQTKAVSANNIILLGAEHCPNFDGTRMHMPTICKNGKVDTGNALFSAQKVIHRKWKSDRIDDGPFIVDTCNMNVKATTFQHLIASYYNGLLCDRVASLSHSH